ncbi:hypothetical protein KQ303_02015 [Synechococcus sp. CS-1333]|nr:hypothetical protein [Synechococcus sp. CS-1333]
MGEQGDVARAYPHQPLINLGIVEGAVLVELGQLGGQWRGEPRQQQRQPEGNQCHQQLKSKNNAFGVINQRRQV